MADFDTNDFEQFITARLDFETGTPPTGNTGDMEQFITARLDLEEYTEKIRIFLTTGAFFSTVVG